MWYVTVLLLFALCPNRKWELLSLVTWKINVHIFLPPNLTELFNYLTSYSIFTPTAFFLLWIHLPASVFLAVSWLFDSTRQPPQPHLEKSLCCSLLSGETLYFLVTLPQPWQSLVRKSNSALLKSHPRLTEGNLSASQQNELLFMSGFSQEPAESCTQLSCWGVCVVCSCHTNSVPQDIMAREMPSSHLGKGTLLTQRCLLAS